MQTIDENTEGQIVVRYNKYPYSESDQGDIDIHQGLGCDCDTVVIRMEQVHRLVAALQSEYAAAMKKVTT